MHKQHRLDIHRHEHRHGGLIAALLLIFYPLFTISLALAVWMLALIVRAARAARDGARKNRAREREIVTERTTVKPETRRLHRPPPPPAASDIYTPSAPPPPATPFWHVSGAKKAEIEAELENKARTPTRRRQPRAPL